MTFIGVANKWMLKEQFLQERTVLFSSCHIEHAVSHYGMIIVSIMFSIDDDGCFLLIVDRYAAQIGKRLLIKHCHLFVHKRIKACL